MKDLYIIGAGGFGREIIWIVERINQVQNTWNINGFIDDDISFKGKIIDGYKVVGTVETLSAFLGAWAVCAVGNAKVRKTIIERLPDTKFATLIDPDVKMSNRILVGEGSIICAGTILTVDISIGKHNIINLDCTVGHDAIFDNFVTMYPSVNVSGQVSIGRCVELGTGSSIIQGIHIGEKIIIGAGAVVVKDLKESGTYVGCPVKRISV